MANFFLNFFLLPVWLIFQKCPPVFTSWMMIYCCGHRLIEHACGVSHFYWTHLFSVWLIGNKKKDFFSIQSDMSRIYLAHLFISTFLFLLVEKNSNWFPIYWYKNYCRLRSICLKSICFLWALPAMIPLKKNQDINHFRQQFKQSN